MIAGLALGKHLLLLKQAGSDHGDNSSSNNTRCCSPRVLYLLGSLMSTGCMLAASFLKCQNDTFWIYLVLMGPLNGFFAGMAYQAPMLASQLHFPDRKNLIGALLLLGLATGVGLYSGLTYLWVGQSYR